VSSDQPYFYRGSRAAIDIAVEDTRVICLKGPRQCGKTTLTKALSPEREFITLDDPTQLALAKKDPLGFIHQRERFCTIDEIQRAPELVRCIKLVVDEQPRTFGRYLITGSADIFKLKEVEDSLAGRVQTIDLAPFTEEEREQSQVNFLENLITGKLDLSPRPVPKDEGSLSLPDRIVQGGYPEPILGGVRRIQRWHREYLKAIISRDVKDISDIRREKEVFLIFKLLTTRTAELVNFSSISRDSGLHRETVSSYLKILDKLFLVRELEAWHQNPAKRLIRSPKFHIVDSGLAASFLNLKASDWMTRRDQMGHLLETFVVNQLIAQKDWFENDLIFTHYRDKDKNEVDLIIENYDQVWAIEVKASMSVTHSDLKALIKFADLCGSRFVKGIIFYQGESIIQMADHRILAVPFHLLWQKTS